MASTPEPISVLFVCLGNICRSTMAEGIFRSMVSKPPYEGLISEIDSCGTGAYHSGSSPDSRTMSTLEDNGITDYDHAARKVSANRFSHYRRLPLHRFTLLISRSLTSSLRWTVTIFETCRDFISELVAKHLSSCLENSVGRNGRKRLMTPTMEDEMVLRKLTNNLHDSQGTS